MTNELIDTRKAKEDALVSREESLLSLSRETSILQTSLKTAQADHLAAVRQVNELEAEVERLKQFKEKATISLDNYASEVLNLQDAERVKSRLLNECRVAAASESARLRSEAESERVALETKMESMRKNILNLESTLRDVEARRDAALQDVEREKELEVERLNSRIREAEGENKHLEERIKDLNETIAHIVSFLSCIDTSLILYSSWIYYVYSKLHRRKRCRP